MFPRLGVLAALLMAFAGLPCDAGIIPVKPAQSSAAAEAAARDLVLTIHARRLLLKDRELGSLNVGVQVRNRVAVLWGPVPSAELAIKAETCIQAMYELIEVRSELYVTGDETRNARPAVATLPPAEVRPALPTLSPRAVPGMPAPLAVIAPRQAPPAEAVPESLPMRLPKQ